jgi:putative tryptophan/tyrosine transport system substrate-binding protein
VKRREFFTLLGSATAWPVAARAQQTAMPVIGFLNPQSPDAYAEPLRGLRQGLKDAGYVEGENLAIEYRWADNQMERLPALAADLVRRRVAVILTTGGPSSARAAKAATTTIPVVFNMAADPVELGLIASLARPGDNVTGITFLALELTAKRLELLREMVPEATRVGVLTNPADSAVSQSTVREMEAAGRTMGLQIQVFNADTGREIEAAFEIIGRERPDALFVAVTPFMVVRRIQLVQRAAFHRIPTAYPLRDFAEAGGLMSYGASLRDAYRQVGAYAGHILNGAKPAEMPVVQSTKFELVINHPTARMLGLTVPPTLLSTADEVIE